MRLLAALSCRLRWRMTTSGALVLAGLVVGSLSGIALVAPAASLTTTTISPGHHDEITFNTGTGSRTVPIGAKGITSDISTPAPSLRSAGQFFLKVLEQKVNGDWAKAWQSLHPLHQQIAPRDSFIRCETATPFPAPLDSIRVVRVRTAPVQVPGVPGPVSGAAVTVAVALRWYGPRDPITFTYTFHLVAVHGRWTWLLSLDRYRVYSEDACFARLPL